jgi:fibronectin-binding autotransporter adhesin
MTAIIAISCHPLSAVPNAGLACAQTLRWWSLALILALGAGNPLTAATATWTGAGGDNNWSTAANWGGTAPTAGDSLVFAGSTRLTANNDLTVDTSFASVTFASGAGAFMVSGNRIILAGNLTNSSATGQTIALAMIVTGATTITCTSAAMTLNGIVSGAGSLTTAGASTLTFGVDNTYSGGTTVSAGTVNAAGTGLGSGTVTVSAGGTLAVGSGTGLSAQYVNVFPASADFTSLANLQAHLATKPLALIGTTSTLNFGGDGSGFPAPYASFANQFEGYYSGTLTVPSTATYTFNTSSDDGSVLFVDGTLVVNNNFFQGITTRTGAISLAAGPHDLVVGFYQGFGGYGMNAQISGADNTTMVDLNTTNAVLAPATLEVASLGGAGALQLTAGGLVTGRQNGSTTFNGVISGSGGLVKLGTGTFILSGNNTYSGLTRIDGGILQVGGGGVAGTLGPGPVSDNASLVFARSGAIAVGSLISGTGTLTMNGSGTLTLNAHNSYSGTTTISQGTVNASGTALGTGAVSVASGATLAVTGSSGLVARYYNDVPLSANFVSLAALQGHLGSLPLALVNTVTTLNFASNGSGFPAPYASNANNFAAIYSGRFTISTAGTYTFNTSSDDGSMLFVDSTLVVNNNFFQGVTTRSGAITLSTGVHDLVVAFYQGNGGYGMNAQISGADNTTMVDVTTANATLTPDLVVSSVTGAGAVALTDGGLITGSDGTSTTLSGGISGPGGLVKGGAGTLTLSGSSTYGGTTFAATGTLTLAAGAALGNTAITVCSGATLANDPGAAAMAIGTTGAGTLGAMLTLGPGTIYDMVDGAVGTCNLRQNASFAPTPLTMNGATLNLEIGSAGVDALSATLGATTSGTNAIAMTALAGGLTVGGTYPIITATGGLSGAMWQFSGGGTQRYMSSSGTGYLLTLSSSDTAITVTVSDGVDIWNGTTSTDWNDPTNWSLGLVPTANHEVQIGNGSGAFKVVPAVTAAGGTCQFLTFTGASATVGGGGGTLTLGAGGLTASIAGSGIACPVTLAANQTWTSTVSTFTVSGVIGGAFALGKAGSGAVTLSGANTFTGGVTLAAGTLNLNSTAALGGAAGLFTIAGGTTIDNTSGAAIAIAANNPETWNGDFTVGGTNSLDLGTGTVALGAALRQVTVSASTLTVGGVISGSGGVNKVGAGALTLSGANTFTGGVTLTAGKLNLGNAAALGTVAGTFTIAGGILDNSTGGALTIAANNPQSWSGDFTFTGTSALNLGTAPIALGAATRRVTVSASTLTVGGAISGAGGLAKLGAGTLVLTTACTYAGGTDIFAGTVKTQLAAPQTITGFGGNGTGWTLNNGSSVTGDVLSTTDNGLGEARSAFLSARVPITGFSASFTYQAAGNRAADGATFVLQNDSRGAAAIGGGGGGMGYNGISPSAAVALNIFIGNVRGSRFFTGGNVSPPYSSSAPVDLSSGHPISVALTYDGSTGLSETLTDLTTADTFTSSQTIGVLSASVGGTSAFLGFSAATGGASAIQTISSLVFTGGGRNGLPAGTALTIAPGATLDLVGCAQTVASLADNGGGGQVTNSGSADANLTIGGSSTTTFSGVISDGGSNKTALAVTGSGALILTGSNTYTGATAVSGGTLLVNGSIAAGSAVAIATGGTLGGNGTVGGTVAMAAGGRIAPGSGGTAIGTLATGSVTGDAAAIYSVDLDGVGPTGDRVLTPGTVACAGTLTVASTGNPAIGKVYTIISAGTVSGTFRGLVSGALFTQLGRTFQIAYTGTTVTLTDVVRPTTRVWDGGGADNNWTTAANWDFDLAPSAGDDLQFAGSTRMSPNNDFTPGTSFASITFNSGAGAFTLGGNTLALGGTIANGGATLQTVTLPLSLATTHTVDAASGDLAFSGVISGPGGLTKLGSGVVTLTASESYSGQTTMSAGTLRIGDGTTDGSISASSAIVDNATLAYVLVGKQVCSVGVSGSGSLIKGGGGELAMVAANSYAGSTTITGGTLLVVGSLGSGIPIANAGFETPAFGFGDWSYTPAGASWTFVGAGVGANGSPWVQTAPEGTRSGFVQNNGSITQTITVAVSGLYALSFQAANRPGFPDSGISVQIDGIPLVSYPIGTFASGAVFSNFTVPTVALTSGTHTLAFVGTQNGGDSATAIDQVVAAPVSAGSLPSTTAVSITASGATLNISGATQSIAALTGVVGSSLIDSGSLTVGDGTSTTFAGTISGAGMLTKAGSGVLTLSGSSTATGALAVGSGTLTVTGATATGSAVNVSNGATLAGTGTVAGTVSLSTGATLAPGVGGLAIGTLTTGSATCNAASTFAVDLNGATPTNDRESTADAVACAGTLTIASIVNAALAKVYTIVSAGTVSGTFSGLVNGAMFTQQGRTFQIVYTATTVTLTDVVRPTTRVWDGGGADNNWTTAANWDFDLAPVAGDDLQFAGSTRTSPNNDFTAATSFASITFNSGASAFTLGGNGITLAGAVTNSGTALHTVNLALALAGTRTMDAASGDLALGGVVSGAGGVTKAGSNVLTLSGGSIYTGITTISGGILSVSNNTNISSTTVNVASGAVLEYNNSGDITQANLTLSGSGTVRKRGTGTLTFGVSGPVTWNLASGSLIDVQQGILCGGSFIQDDWTTNLSSLNIAGGATFLGVEANVRIDSLTGSGFFDTGYPGAGYAAITIGVNNGSGTFSGVIEDRAAPGNVVKSGTGTQTLSGINTYTGTTTVSAGTLLVSGSTVAASPVTVSNGATLGGTGTVAGTVALAAGSTLAPGLGGTGIGTLNTGSVTCNATSALSLDLDGTTPTNDRVTTAGTVACAGTLTIGSNAHAAVGKVYTFVSAGTVSGTFSGLATNTVFTQAGRLFRIAYAPTAVTLTDCAPAVTARQTLDADGNGHIDRIRLTFDLPLNDDTSGLTVTVAGYTVTGFSTGAVANDNQIEVLVSELGAGDTGATPAVRITANTSLKHPLGSGVVQIEGSATAATDAAAPVLLSTAWTDGGTGGVSAGDTVTLTFSESVTATAMTVTDLGLPVTSDTLSTTTIANQTGSSITMTLAGSPRLTPGGTYNAAATGAGKPSGVFVASGAHLQDAVGLAPATGNAASARDLGPGTSTVAIAWSTGSDPRTWALGVITVGTIANSITSGLDLTVLDTGDCNVDLTIASALTAPSNWAPAASAGANAYLMKAGTAAAAVGAPANPTSYTLTLTTSAQTLASGILSGTTSSYALYFQAPTSISGGGGTLQTIVITITAAISP